MDTTPEYTYVCLHARTICIHKHVCAKYVSVRVCVCVCMYVCTCIHAHKVLHEEIRNKKSYHTYHMYKIFMCIFMTACMYVCIQLQLSSCTPARTFSCLDAHICLPLLQNLGAILHVYIHIYTYISVLELVLLQGLRRINMFSAQICIHVPKFLYVSLSYRFVQINMYTYTNTHTSCMHI